MKNKALKLITFVIILVGAYFINSIGFSNQEVKPLKDIELKNTLKTKKGLNFKSKKNEILKKKIKKKSEEVKKQISLSNHQRDQMIEEFIDRSGTSQIFDGLRKSLTDFIEKLPVENKKQKRIRLKLVNLIDKLLDYKPFIEELKNEFKKGYSDNILIEVNELYKSPVMEKMVTESELKFSSPDLVTDLQKLHDNSMDLSEKRIQLYKDLDKSGTENAAVRDQFMETFQKGISLSIVKVFVSEMPEDQRPSIENLKKSIDQEFEKNRVNEEGERLKVLHLILENFNEEEIKEIIKSRNNGSMKKFNDGFLNIFMEDFKRRGF